MLTHAIEIPIILDQLHVERQAWALDIVADPAAQEWDTDGHVRTCVERAVKGPLAMMHSDRSTLCAGSSCFKWQQPTGRSADRGTGPAHSIAHCFPPALQGAVQIEEIAWR
jgi:hypothetical protein